MLGRGRGLGSRLVAEVNSCGRMKKTDDVKMDGSLWIVVQGGRRVGGGVQLVLVLSLMLWRLLIWKSKRREMRMKMKHGVEIKVGVGVMRRIRVKRQTQRCSTRKTMPLHSGVW